MHLRHPRTPLAIITLVIAITSAFGCDPYSDVKVGLNPVERERFARGQRAATACWTCHDVTGSDAKVGPGLQDLMGRRAGTVPGFPHSSAMRASGITWNPRSLDAFLSDVQRYVPGNRMVAPGVPDPRLRADLIFFLLLTTPSKGS